MEVVAAEVAAPLCISSGMVCSCLPETRSLQANWGLTY
jgi:hypothetical protein